MPTERFHHLPEEKKRKIRLAAVEEFSRVPLEKVSINKIIQAAEISRGSFYTYFEDKSDLLCYIMKDLHTTTIDSLISHLKETGGDFFQTIDQLMVDLLGSPQIANSDFFRHVMTGLTLSRNVEQFLWGFADSTEECALLEQRLYELTDLSGCDIHSRDDFHALLELTTMLVISMVGKNLICTQPPEQVLKQFRRQFYYLKNGILSRPNIQP